MNDRNTFIAIATACYSIIALVWIFLTDSLLRIFVDIESLLWLSTAKGILFIILSAAFFFMALRAVPSDKSNGISIWDSVTQGLAPHNRPHWLLYVFSIVITLAMLAFVDSLAGQFKGHPLLILCMLPIILSALLGGFGPGLFTTVIAALGVDYLTLAPVYSFRIDVKYDLLQWTFLIVNGIAVSLLSEVLRRSLAKAEFNQSLFNAVLSGTSDAIFVKDIHGRYVMANTAVVDIIGKKQEDIIGHDDFYLFPEPTAQILMNGDRGIMSAATSRAFEEHIVTFDGKVRDFLVNKGAVFDHAGKVVGIFGISRDITERKQAEATFRSLYDNMMNSVVHCRVIFENDQPVDLEYLAVNPAFAEVTGIYENPVGRKISEVIPGYCERNKDSLSVFGNVALSGISARWEHYLAELDRWFSMYAYQTAAGEITIIGENISERKNTEKKLQLAASVFTHAREGIMITNANGVIIDVNDAFSRITGYRHDEVLGKNPNILNSGLNGKELYADLWQSLIQKGFWSGEIWNRHKDGQVFAEMLTISSVKDPQGRVQQYVALFTDITALKQHQKELEYIANYDTLTQLPNRLSLSDRILHAMSHVQRRERIMAVIYLDLDGFKQINDKYGHDIGDKLLISIAARMRETLREEDTLARLGGDEFVAVLLDLNTIEDCIPMCQRLLEAVSQSVMVGKYVLQVSASLGVTFYPQPNEMNADLLLRQADQAMYQAKLKGKNRYHVFDAAQDNNIRSHHEKIESLQRALINQEFVLFYQPKVNMRSGAIIGAEALIRWQHPERGLVPPLDFLPLIEDHNLSINIGEWVIDTALTQIEQWQSCGLNIPVSVNVGAYQLQHGNFVDSLREILAKHPGFISGNLELEILESSALKNIDHVIKIIQSCRANGVAFALDDFGTGYSSLTYLKRLPVTQLKIDQSFVRDMLKDPDDLAILEGVLGLSRAFHHHVIAEGVETVEHGKMLLELGCESAQGYGIARPMPATQLLDWTTQWQLEPAWKNACTFSRDDLPLLFARVEHWAWVESLEQYLEGRNQKPPSSDPNDCRLGNWLRTIGLVRYGHEPIFENIIHLHQTFHSLGSSLIDDSNQTKVCDRSELHRIRDELIEQLQAFHGICIKTECNTY